MGKNVYNDDTIVAGRLDVEPKFPDKGIITYDAVTDNAVNSGTTINDIITTIISNIYTEQTVILTGTAWVDIVAVETGVFFVLAHGTFVGAATLSSVISRNTPLGDTSINDITVVPSSSDATCYLELQWDTVIVGPDGACQLRLRKTTATDDGNYNIKIFMRVT
jgi:hypothetical protein